MIRHTKSIWASPPVSGGALLVLLALAEHASEEDDSCFPGITRLMAMTVQSERGVQNAIRTLRDAGIISIQNGNGRNNTNRYVLHLKTPQILTTQLPEKPLAEPVKTPQHLHPATSAPPQMLPETPQIVPKTPQMVTVNPATSAPKAPLSTREPPEEAPKKFMLPEWVPKDLWGDWEKCRKKMRAEHTDQSRSLGLKRLSELVRQGYTAESILEAAIERSWRGLFPPPGIQPNATRGSNGNGYHHPTKSAQSDASSMATLELFRARDVGAQPAGSSGTREAGRSGHESAGEIGGGRPILEGIR